MAAQGATDTVMVVAGGDPVELAHLPRLDPGTIVIAADSGVDHAHALGLVVDLAVGDFDSVSPAGLARATAEGARVERHPAEKDATDLELALDAALTYEPARIHLLGGHGGRLDHLLANLLLLASDAYATVEVTAQMGAARVTVVRRSASLRGAVGDPVSLLAVHGLATGVSTSGLLYPLRAEDLLPGSPRGLSNELTHEQATVSLVRGVLVAIQPGGPA
jgi:thiamine pyrophosphokinase